VAGDARAPRAPRLTLRIRLTAILGLVALLLVGTLGAQLVLQSRQRDIRNELLERVDPALVALGDLRAGLVDQETGVRGYALAGDPRFLEPYERGQGAAADATSRLAELLDDSPLADEVRTVDELTESWRVEIAEPSIAATQQGTGIAATDEFQLAGRQRFEAIRAAIDDVDDALSAERAE
jgi:CHASE3 domain sensor protein